MEKNNNQKNQLQPSKSTNPLPHLFAGALAGLVDATATHPIDTIKTRLQLQTKTNAKYRGMIHAFLTIIKEEGPFAVYKGFTPVACGIAPKVAIRFTAFEQFKGLLQNDKGQMTWQKNLLAGLGAGMVESILVVTPVELVKIRLQSQLQSGATAKYKGQIHAIQTIIKEEGIFALYKGLVPTMIRQGFQQGIKFMTYNEIKKYLQDGDPKKNLTLPQQLIGGAIANSIGAILNTPIDVVKTRIQKQDNSFIKYKNPLHCATVILKEEGITAFFKGVVPRVTRIAPAGAIQFAVFEQVMKLIQYFSSTEYQKFSSG